MLTKKKFPVISIVLLLLISFISQLNGHQLVEANEDSFSQVPGLYDSIEGLTNIVGQKQFEASIYPTNEVAYKNDTVKMVQFYMATCPDCQGFSPYFKRLVSDIGSAWSQMLKVIVVNCNDDKNIALCWSQNPKLIVPMVRWYPFKQLIASNSLDDLKNSSWNHRETIFKQRRDHISLRHATLDAFSRSLTKSLSNNDMSSSRAFQAFHWSTFEPLDLQKGRYESVLLDRNERCVYSKGLTDEDLVYNFLIIDKQGSYIGKTIVADWSNRACHRFRSLKRSYLVHSSNNFDDIKSELNRWTRMKSASANLSAPIVAYWIKEAFAEEDPEIRWKIILSGADIEETIAKRRDSSNGGSNKPAQRVQQINHLGRRILIRRDIINSSTLNGQNYSSNLNNSSSDSLKQLEAENINWAPPQLYENEEITRKLINYKIGEIFFGKSHIREQNVSIPGFEDGNPGEIKSIKKDIQKEAMKPKEEDLSRVTLTDYYKVLTQSIKQMIISRAYIDGYRMLSSTCWLQQLIKDFPFQGIQEQNSTSSSSISRSYLIILEKKFTQYMNEQLGLNNTTSLINCYKRKDNFNFVPSIKKSLDKLRISPSYLESIERNIELENPDIGLPIESKLRYTHCAGSSPHLRGQTCSLWILFHTLTVHEYLNGFDSNHHLQETLSKPEEYKFQVNYEKNQIRANCSHSNPESAYLSSSSKDLFVDGPKYALTNIVNFVRFYLPCTNCAAHFSCMVAHSDIDPVDPKPGDHLLWLWEAHNRVNIRTKNTHSEDPVHPKHIFPTFEACRECYLEEPKDPITGGGKLESIRFNRNGIIKFMVSRYRRTAILNNKIRIEDLYKKT